MIHLTCQNFEAIKGDNKTGVSDADRDVVSNITKQKQESPKMQSLWPYV